MGTKRMEVRAANVVVDLCTLGLMFQRGSTFTSGADRCGIMYGLFCVVN